jgi:hypothetical protein
MAAILTAGAMLAWWTADRLILLRVDKPELSGDLLNRFSLIEAERTGKTASGIESGVVGVLTLRVVRPVFDAETLVGYVELGKEIDGIFRNLRVWSGTELAVLLRKETLNRETCEASMCLRGREADWDRLSHSVVIWTSQGRLPDAFAPLADHASESGHAHGVTDREIASDGKDWRVMCSPLQDASGKEVGDLLITSDITAEKAAFARNGSGRRGRSGSAGGPAGPSLCAAAPHRLGHPRPTGGAAGEPSAL